MSHPPLRDLNFEVRLTAVVTFVSIAALLPSSGHAEPYACAQAISRASGKFVRFDYKALRKCNDAVVKGARSGPCPDADTSARLAKLAGKFRRAIDAKCGGADRQCGGGDDDSLSSIGWNVGACPNFETGTCTNAIVDCGDVAQCLSCVTSAAVEQAIALTYGDLDHGPRDSRVVGCQRAIGKNTEKFFGARVQAMQRCEERVLFHFATGPCPDAIAVAAIAKAETKKVRGICKLCSGAAGNRQCGTADDLSPTTIGFTSSCPDVTVPGGASCAAPITDLQGIVDCVDCVAAFKADCVDALAVPQLVAYPSECRGGATATPGLGTGTPTPSASPTNTVPGTVTASPIATPTAVPTSTETATVPQGTPTPTLTLPLPTITLPLPTITLPLPSLTLPLPSLTLPLPSLTLPLPSLTLPLPSLTLPLPTLPLPTISLPLETPTIPLPLETPTLPLPSLTLPLPSLTLPLPSLTLPLPSLTLPLPSLTLPLPSLTLPLPTTTPMPTATPFCGNGTIDPGEVCELPAVHCGLLQVCLLCQQCL